VDVRENKELIVASVKGAQHIRIGDIPRRINELPKQKEIGLLCHTGVRSGQVAVFLRQHGFNAINIQGGIDLWSRSVDSTVPRY
ncbi:MAG: rhodanese-like domain-containing protein, partial [Candidatus Heimdallarchaeota archaeon]